MFPDEHLQRFTSFAQSHLNGETVNDYHIKLKLDHSLRVLDNARLIMEGESINGHTARLTTLAALYHDIGRFPQFVRYGTFMDSDSENHARLGVLTLRDLDLPGDVPESDWKVVRAAIGLHNAKELNPDLEEPTGSVTRVVRDADKVDIFKVLLDHLSRDAEAHEVVIHSLTVDPDKYTPEVFDTVMKGEICDYKLLRYSNDFILLLAGWVYCLNYDTSVKLLAKRGLVKRTFSLLPDTEVMHKLRDKTFAFIDYKMQSAA